MCPWSSAGGSNKHIGIGLMSLIVQHIRQVYILQRFLGPPGNVLDPTLRASGVETVYHGFTEIMMSVHKHCHLQGSLSPACEVERTVMQQGSADVFDNWPVCCKHLMSSWHVADFAALQVRLETNHRVSVAILPSLVRPITSIYVDSCLDVH